MSSFITNFQSPVELDDLVDRYFQGEITNIDFFLDLDKDHILEWTVPKDAQVGDIVFFMCAKTSANHMAHVCVQAIDETAEIYEFAKKERALYKKYAGKIVAVGKVMEDPFQSDDSGWEAPYWRSPWYAKIMDVQLLENMVDISEFRDFIKVSRTGAITKLNSEQQMKLFDLIDSRNTI